MPDVVKVPCERCNEFHRAHYNGPWWTLPAIAVGLFAVIYGCGALAGVGDSAAEQHARSLCNVLQRDSYQVFDSVRRPAAEAIAQQLSGVEPELRTATLVAALEVDDCAGSTEAINAALAEG